ncbi:hypothetical protein HYH03_017136 [Edaphochlamys debaryana]|uniref:Uncharacterized protein n=1 Tax=Edaphochlamys debaryana TaxID=47281 RepID=A0A836BP79_9CHLO|nr:hypothetical protein HYH03_017136 [Edaphochlamys debaryana]|eukprot:KAG2484046.1 hypothetical protein HYH03_017136 [Edaphochlamys debaryana]
MSPIGTETGMDARLLPPRQGSTDIDSPRMDTPSVLDSAISPDPRSAWFLRRYWERYGKQPKLLKDKGSDSHHLPPSPPPPPPPSAPLPPAPPPPPLSSPAGPEAPLGPTTPLLPASAQRVPPSPSFPLLLRVSSTGYGSSQQSLTPPAPASTKPGPVSPSSGSPSAQYAAASSGPGAGASCQGSCRQAAAGGDKRFSTGSDTTLLGTTIKQAAAAAGRSGVASVVPLVMALAYTVLLLGVFSLVFSQLASTTANPLGFFAGIMPRTTRPNPALVTRLPTSTPGASTASTVIADPTAAQRAFRVMGRSAAEDALLGGSLDFGASLGAALFSSRKTGSRNGDGTEASAAGAKGGAGGGAKGQGPHTEAHAMRVAASLGASFWDKPENRQPLARAEASSGSSNQEESTEVEGSAGVGVVKGRQAAAVAAGASGAQRLHRKAGAVQQGGGGAKEGGGVPQVRVVDSGSGSGSEAEQAAGAMGQSSWWRRRGGWR